METSTMIILAAIATVAVVAWILYDQHRTKKLRERFGPEYDRTVLEFGNQRRAEAELEKREAYAERMKTRSLAPATRHKFLTEWKLCQAQFVDDPAGAVEHADRLLAEIMDTRGYATENAYLRMTDIAAAYPLDADRYRQANRIVANSHRGDASTEDLRTAFLNYRILFNDLLAGDGVVEGVDDEKYKRAA
jgi:hypothetical protein